MENESEIAKASKLKHKLILNRTAEEKIHGSNIIGKVNTYLALFITKAVGSMWCAYIFAILAIISLPAAIRSHDPIIIVAWIAQTFLQLVLLPIIIVGQNVQAEASDQRAQHDHLILMAIHTLSTEIYKITERQAKILDLLEKTTESLNKKS
jgi:hypothetical protein